jgi:type IV pilus assembly protein PilQ
MRFHREITAGALCAGCLWLALAQDAPSPEGRRGRVAKPTNDVASSLEPAGASGLAAAAAPLAESVDYTKLLEQFLKARDEQTEVYFYRCKYISAETMRRLLENFLTPAGTAGRSDEDDIVVVSDVPARLPQLKQIIEQADQPVAQVLVEARIVELEISNDLTRDVNMGIAKTGASDSVRKIFQDILVPGTSGSAGTETLDHSYTAGKRSDGTLWTFVGVDQVKIWAMITYLEEKGRARILSSPNLVIRRGADGNIMNGEKIPVLERTITGSSESISTRFENVGVKLIVRPIMISGKRIHVKVNPEVSSAPRSVTTGNFETPVIVVRSASTQLEANDGELITIGGLMREEQRVVERRIPYLADIPYLGVLFQYKQSKSFTSQIVIFMTMRLVEPGAYEALSVQRQSGVPSDIRERVQAIEYEVNRDNQTIWKELPK